MPIPKTGSFPAEGKCEICGAELVMTYADFTMLDGRVVRLTQGPVCLNGHIQLAPKQPPNSM